MRLYRRGTVWWVYFTTPSGEEVRQTTRQRDKKRADAAARELERRACDPTYRASHETTVEQALKNFLVQAKREGLAEGTLDMYDVKTAHLARLFGKATPLAKVTAALVDGYVQKREEEGAKANTVHKELTALRRVLKLARRRGEFDQEISQVMPRYSSGYVPRERFLTRQELDRVLAVVPADVGAWICWAIATGSRLSEVGRARRAHVSFDESKLAIKGTKTAGAKAEIPIVSSTRELLERALRDGLPGDRFLPTWGRVKKVLETGVKKEHFVHFTPNDLRRTTATWLVEGGVRTDLVARLLRHKDSRMVDRVYGRTGAQALGKLIEDGLAGEPGEAAK